MKNQKYTITLFMVALSWILCACKDDFLDKPALGALDEAVLANRKGVDGLLIGAYSQLNGSPAALWFASPSNFLFGSIAGGDAHKGADGGSEVAMDPIMRMTVDPTNGYLNAAWNYYYEGVTRANSVLRVAQMAEDIPEDELANILGQARFIRGHFYFYLKKMFNNVPWIDEHTFEYSQPNNIDIWPMIEDDFRYAMDHLYDTQRDVGRVNKWAAASYLAQTYVYQSKYQEAKPLYDEIITQGVTSNGLGYNLTPQYSQNFDAATQNNQESVFSIQMVAQDGTNDILNANVGDMLNFPYGGPFSCCGIFQPSQDLVNSYRTDENGLPIIQNYNQYAVRNDMGISSNQPFEPDQGPLDPRLDWTVGRRGVPFLDWGNHPGEAWVRDQAYGGPYAPKKNVFRQATQDQYASFYSWAPGTAINLNIIRFSDVLLMAAETEASLGNLSQAEQYVNRVRERAANPDGFVKKYINEGSPLEGFSNEPAANYVVAPYPSGTFAAMGQQESLRAIYFERKLELGMEGHRFFDISRWGIAEETLNAYYQYEQTVTSDLGGAHFTSNKNEHYPIPQIQIDLTVSAGQTTLQQNPGYQ